MRRPILLAVLLTLPGLVAAQVSQTDSKPSSKPKPSSTTTREAKPSALERARSGQKQSPDKAVPDESAPGDAPDASADRAEDQAADAGDPKQPLAAKMFLTHDPANFSKAWKAGADSLPTTGSISQTNPVIVMVAVSGCASGKDGKCSLEFTSRTAGPDGQFDKPRISPPWKPEPIRGKPEIAPASFGLRLGPGDPPGRYTIEVRVTDVVAKASRTLTGTVTKPTSTGGR